MLTTYIKKQAIKLMNENPNYILSSK